MLVELEEVVGGGDQPPFRERGRSSSSLELVDAPVVLGLCEHRLDYRLSSSVEPVSVLGRECVAHRRVSFALPSQPRGLALASVRRHENLHVLVRHDMVHLLLIRVAAIGNRDPWCLRNTNRLEFPLGRLHHRLEVTEVR